ncbi:hypothetical protein CBOM_05666 [Ceraceosorus bombacis]|uniref:Uncharacterized protein n=1 Tax=Ceraceosorus bombacis TaxID=401625 RepID=A0A0P1BQ04_9BASI|nr:hypothetical protein CBOM_05666 [Ceraceosorus bombacis]
MTPVTKRAHMSSADEAVKEPRQSSSPSNIANTSVLTGANDESDSEKDELKEEEEDVERSISRNGGFRDLKIIIGELKAGQVLTPGQKKRLELGLKAAHGEYERVRKSKVKGAEKQLVINRENGEMETGS